MDEAILRVVGKGHFCAENFHPVYRNRRDRLNQLTMIVIAETGEKGVF